MHKVPDHALVTEELIARLGAEASQQTISELVPDEHGVKQLRKRALPGPFCAVLETGSGQPQQFGSGPQLCAEQGMLAIDMVKALNRELHHDGCWLFCFCNPSPQPIVLVTGVEYGRFVILWMDQDGDVQFSYECDRPFELYLIEGPLPLMEKCEKAWQQWHLYMRQVLDPQPDELYKKALGEAPKVMH
jgi:hypothetical protein